MFYLNFFTHMLRSSYCVENNMGKVFVKKQGVDVKLT